MPISLLVRSPFIFFLIFCLLRPPLVFSATPPVQDVGWPRQIANPSGTLVFYQPQLDEWKDYKELSGRIAFALTPHLGKEVHGVASATAGTLVDKNSRTVYLRDITITSVRFPSLDATAAGPMEKLFREMFPTGGEPMDLDRVTADLDRSNVSATPVEMNNDPPRIFYSTTPAILLMVEGEPVLAPVEKTDLQFLVNTNWDVFFDKDKKDYFLMAEKVWLTSKNLEGPWAHATKLPGDMSKLPPNENWNDVKAAVPPPPGGKVPQVFFSGTPAELVLTNGMPVYTKIPGTTLLYVANTDSDVFVDTKDSSYYVLLSGRWFRAKGFNGPWSFASADLPQDFMKIPPDSPKKRVLASVPGTIEASDAVMLAQIPTTAILTKSDAEAAVKVNYDGDPQFKPIEGTSMQYATNTQEKVIQVGNEYYVCYNAVWLVSANPNGPWKVADTIPQEIYKIPPSSPVYNVTYVTQTTTADTVTSSAAAGYMGLFIFGAAVGTAIAFGTGYYYPPYMYYGPGMVYPIYRPWPMTYGAAAVYNPWTGGFAVGHRAYGPYGSVGSSAWYNPATGRYGRSASAQGWYGGRTVASSYNPWTGGYAATSQGHNPYSQWGRSAAVRGDQWVQTGHVTTGRGTIAGYNTSGGQKGAVYRGQNGTIARGSNYTYAGSDGNVYRRDNNGNWSQYGSGGWNNVNAPNRTGQNISGAERQTAPANAATMNGLNRSYQTRQRGQAQVGAQRTFRSGGGRFRR